MRVAADQLRGHALGDAAEVAGVSLLEQQGEEEDLKEDVAELVEELRVVAAVGGVGELVGLLDGVGDDRALVLLAVPGALAAQAARDLVEALESGGCAHARRATAPGERRRWRSRRSRARGRRCCARRGRSGARGHGARGADRNRAGWERAGQRLVGRRRVEEALGSPWGKLPGTIM